jgi:phosphate transport system permease protein
VKAAEAAAGKRTAPAEAVALGSRVLPGAAAILAAAAIVLGCAALLDNSFDAAAVPLLAALALVLGVWLGQARYARGIWERELIVLLAGCLAAGAVLMAIPEYTYGHQINGIIHRSLFSGLFLLAMGTGVLCYSIYHLLGATPSAHDVSRYPLIIVPIALALGAYGLLLARLIDDGISGLSWDALTTAYSEKLEPTGFVYEVGLRNHILGTFLLMGLTSLIALPAGFGAGMYVAENEGWMSRLIAFCTTMLRAISVFVLGVAAFSLVDFAEGYAVGNPISDFIRGYYSDANGFKHPAEGSFLLAAVFLSLLAIPVIARSTEEGFRSVPTEIREGSVALGATEGHGFLRILLPWALPSVITGLLIGAAEVAGSVAVILFIAGTGQNGVGPFDETTSLSYLIFDVKYGPQPVQDLLAKYQFTAALMLVFLTLTLTIGALFIKNRFARRYQGAS